MFASIKLQIMCNKNIHYVLMGDAASAIVTYFFVTHRAPYTRGQIQIKADQRGLQTTWQAADSDPVLVPHVALVLQNKLT